MPPKSIDLNFINMAELATLSIKHHHPWDDAAALTSSAAKGERSPHISCTPRTQARPKRLRNAECRELLSPQNPFLPGIHVHGSACRCGEIQTANEAADAVLAQKIASLSKSILLTTAPIPTTSITTKPSPPNHTRHRSPRNGILSTLSRLFSPPRDTHPTPPSPSPAFQADLCIGAADLDIDKVARYLVLGPPTLPVNHPNHLGLTPLMAAVQSPAAAARPKAHLEMVRLLVLVCGADAEATRVDRVTGRGESVLSMACVAGRVGVVRFLVAAGGGGGSVNARLPVGAGMGSQGKVGAGRGRTALHAAVEAGRAECVEVLVKEGKADVNAVFEVEAVDRKDGPGAGLKGLRGRTGSVGREGKGKRGRNLVSALHLAHGSQACTRILLKAGAKVDVRDGSGRTPLHWAAEAGDFDVVRLLIGAGADINAAADDGTTPLTALVECLEEGEGHGKIEVSKLLLQGGADLGTGLQEKLMREKEGR